MNKISLFAIATIIVVASFLTSGIFTNAANAQIPTTSGTDPAENTEPGVLPNGTIGNATTNNETASGY